MSEVHKHVSITLTFKTDADPGWVFSQLMDQLGDRAIFVVDSKVSLFELAEEDPYPGPDAERDRLCDAVEKTKTLAKAALKAWKPEHEYHQDRAARKGYSHNEVAAEIYGLAIETVTEILEALGQTAKEPGPR